MTAAGDRITYSGLVAVGTAAAVLSFAALAGLARLTGFDGNVGPIELAWLFPVAVDAYAALTTGVWLRTGTSKGTRNWARANALAAITASMAGNAAYHVTTSSARPWLVVAVAIVPPLSFAAAVHTAVLVAGDRARSHRAESRTQARTEPRAQDRSPARPAVPPVPVSRPDRTATPAAGPRLELVPSEPGDAVRMMRAFYDAEVAAGRTPTGAEVGAVAGRTDSYARKLIRKWVAEDAAVAAAEVAR